MDKKAETAALGSRVKSLRVNKFGGWGGITKISRALGIPVGTYTNYEREPKNGIPGQVVEKLVELTGVSRHWLLFGEGRIRGLPVPGTATRKKQT